MTKPITTPKEEEQIPLPDFKVKRGTICTCGMAKSYHTHPSDDPLALRQGKCTGYSPRYPSSPQSRLSAVDREKLERVLNLMVEVGIVYPFAKASIDLISEVLSSAPVETEMNERLKNALLCDGQKNIQSLLNWIRHTVPDWVPEVEQCMETCENWCKKAGSLLSKPPVEADGKEGK